MTARVVGLGSHLGGDDAVGIAVVEHLRARGAPSEIELLVASDASALLSLLDTKRRVVVVDAVVGGGILGEVVALSGEEIAVRLSTPTSSHGLDVPSAIALARLLFEPDVPDQVDVVGVRIAPSRAPAAGLSAPVRAAVARAARTVMRLARAG